MGRIIIGILPALAGKGVWVVRRHVSGMLKVWIGIVTREGCFARPFREDWLGWSVEDGRELNVVGVGLGVMAGEREGKGIVVENAGEGHVWKRRAIASWDAGQPRQRDSTSNVSATTNLVSHQASSLWPSLIKFSYSGY